MKAGRCWCWVRSDPVTIQARPKQRDAGTEETKFFAEVSNLFLPGPGVVNGRHLVTIRPAQGRVTSLTMKVPAGFTVSDVVDGPVGAWRFDPAKRELRMTVEPAQNRGFCLHHRDPARGRRAADGSRTRTGPRGWRGGRGRVVRHRVRRGSAAGSGGGRGAFAGESGGFQRQVAAAHQGRPAAGAAAACVPLWRGRGARRKLKVTAVAPELRAESWQLVSLGEDRLVVATDLAVTITRSGVFRLDLDVPEGLEIESATGEGLSHWTEGKIDGKRVVTFHLSGKTMGRRDFSLTLTGRPTGAQEKWQVPRLSLRDASRETGVLTVVPERGLQVRAVDRKNVSQLDPRELADGPKETVRAAARPGALAYRLLQSDWALGLSISRLDPWVTARVFHDATIREGQLLSRVHIGYRIENAAVKSLRVRIPGLDATVRRHRARHRLGRRGSGPGGRPGRSVGNPFPTRHSPGKPMSNWNTSAPARRAAASRWSPSCWKTCASFPTSSRCRAGGRLELEAGVVAARLAAHATGPWCNRRSAAAAGSVAPTMAFRVADPEGPLPVVLKRHELADLRKLRVSEGTLTTLALAGRRCSNSREHEDAGRRQGHAAAQAAGEGGVVQCVRQRRGRHAGARGRRLVVPCVPIAGSRANPPSCASSIPRPCAAANASKARCSMCRWKTSPGACSSPKAGGSPATAGISI